MSPDLDPIQLRPDDDTEENEHTVSEDHVPVHMSPRGHERAGVDLWLGEGEWHVC